MESREESVEKVETMGYYDRNGRTCDEAIDIVTRDLCGEDAFNMGCIVKYIWRAGLKPGESFEKDIEKAADYAFKICTGKFPKPRRGKHE